MSKDLQKEYMENLLGVLKGFQPHTPITEDDINNVYTSIRDSYDGDQMSINKIAGEAYKALSASDIDNLKNTTSSKLTKTILEALYDNYEKEVNAHLSHVKSQFDFLLNGLEK